MNKDNNCLIDKLHFALNNNSKDAANLNAAIGDLIVDHGKDAVFTALIECAQISYMRLSHANAKLGV